MGPAFAIFYTIFGIPFGRAADTRSRKHIIAFGLLLWSLMTVGCGLARHFWQMALLRVGVGVGEASLSPSAYSMISGLFRWDEARPRDRRLFERDLPRVRAGLHDRGPGGLDASGHRALADSLLGAVPGWQKVFLIVGLPGLLVVPSSFFDSSEPARRGLVASTKAGDGHDSFRSPKCRVCARELEGAGDA